MNRDNLAPVNLFGTRNTRARNRAAFARVTGSRWAEGLGRRIWREGIRILAYHDVENEAAFSEQMHHLAGHYSPVSAGEVVAAVRDGRPLPRLPVWVTFDDGYPGVIERAQPVLDRHGIRATLFVCPGVVGTEHPFWWTVVRAAVAAGIRPRVDGREWSDVSLVTHLKHRPDASRRAVVERLEAELARRGLAEPARQLRREDLLAWLTAGHDVGNHTWDHPCLDQCPAEEQERQIVQAHEWLAAGLPGCSPVFAYPNGHAPSHAEAFLDRLGYGAAVGFDHRLAELGQSPLRLSRLRVSADADLSRFRAIVSGLHPAAFAVASRFRRIAGDRGRGLSSP